MVEHGTLMAHAATTKEALGAHVLACELINLM